MQTNEPNPRNKKSPATGPPTYPDGAPKAGMRTREREIKLLARVFAGDESARAVYERRADYELEQSPYGPYDRPAPDTLEGDFFPRIVAASIGFQSFTLYGDQPNAPEPKGIRSLIDSPS